MAIVFAENFQNDTPATYGKRYQGSTYNLNGAASVANAWPLSTTGWFQTNIPLFSTTNTRFEALLTFQDSNQVGAAVDFSIFGLEFKGALNALTINGAPCPSLKTKTKLNLIVERKSGLLQLIVVADDVVVVTPTIIDWVPNSFIGGLSPQVGGFQANLPNFMTSLVVAYDTAVGTRLNSSTFADLPITVTSPGDWTFSDVGYVEDTNKSDPTVIDPNISTTTDSTISLEVTTGTSEYTNLYVNKQSDLATQGLSVEGITYPATSTLSVAPVNQLTGSTVELVTTPQLGTSNDDNVTFLGERTDLITYEDFCTQLSFTVGNLIPGDSWLEFVIDGKEVIFSKIPVRSSIHYADLYNNGLVYGTSGPGPSVPTGSSPVDQYRTIVLGGKTYVVRLLKLYDVSPIAFITGYDPVGTQRSEWSRLAYPIYAGTVASYTDLKLASYSDADLGFGSDIRIWGQESKSGQFTLVYTEASRISNTLQATGAASVFRWRPILERVA